MNEDDAQLNLRIPKSVRDSIASAAKKNRRSVTAEVTLRLEESLMREGVDPETGRPIGKEDVRRMIGSLSSRLDNLVSLLERDASDDSA